MFPVINSACFAFPSDPAEQRTEAFIRSQVAGVADATELEVEIDGVAVPHVERWYEESTVFSATLRWSQSSRSLAHALEERIVAVGEHVRGHSHAVDRCAVAAAPSAIDEAQASFGRALR